MKYKNFTISECDRTLQKIMAERPNTTFFQKWTCAGCGHRITGNTPNKLFIYGDCEDCGARTNIQKTGCNYALHMVTGGLADVPPKGNA